MSATQGLVHTLAQILMKHEDEIKVAHPAFATAQLKILSGDDECVELGLVFRDRESWVEIGLQVTDQRFDD